MVYYWLLNCLSDGNKVYFVSWTSSVHSHFLYFGYAKIMYSYLQYACLQYNWSYFMMALFCGNFACSPHQSEHHAQSLFLPFWNTRNPKFGLTHSLNPILGLAMLTSCHSWSAVEWVCHWRRTEIWGHEKLILEGNGRFNLNSSNKLNQQTAHQEGPSQQG